MSKQYAMVVEVDRCIGCHGCQVACKFENDVALGTGQANFPEIFKAAQETGVKYYFIEDESPSFKTQIPQSLKYLETVRW